MAAPFSPYTNPVGVHAYYKLPAVDWPIPINPVAAATSYIFPFPGSGGNLAPSTMPGAVARALPVRIGKRFAFVGQVFP